MPAKKRDLSIQWPFAPGEVQLNHDTNLLKLIAMLTMLCDHMGAILFPQYRIMRIIGRIAFPIYACCIAIGCVYTRDPLRYLKRLVLVALIVQPIYAVAMHHTVPMMYKISFAEQPVRAILNFYIESWAKPSIMCTLIAGMLLVWSLRERHIVLFIAQIILYWLLQRKIDYGMNGVWLILLFYVACTKRWLSLPLVLLFMLNWGLRSKGYELFGVTFGIQTFAILALPFIYIHTSSKLKIPKWVFYGFYPAHLLLIYFLSHLSG